MARKTPAKNRNPTPGDIRLAPLDVIEYEQPLTEDGKALVKRAYELFSIFRDRLRTEHDAMHEARSMRQLKQEGRSFTAPTSMTLNSCADNIIADQIDNMPEAVMIPEREETAQSAEEMTDVVSYVLYQAGWPGKYQRLMEDAVVTGTGIAQVYWDEDMENGDGMVNVMAWHPEDFYPDPMYEDIQNGRGCFKTTLTTVAWIKEHHPDAADYVRGDEIRPDDSGTVMLEAATHDEKVTLLEFWYKRYDAEKRRNRVHMAQLAGGALLYSTELGIGCSETEYREGVYAHGQYPFVFYRYREVFRRPFGTGVMHDYKDQQNAIDRYAKYIDDNARESSIQRYFVRRGSGINVEDIADATRKFIQWDGNDIREVMQTTQAAPLNGQVYQNMLYLSDTMKQDCGQNQFARGEGGMGVTAATAIQMLQSAGGKITRWHVAQFKDGFREMVEQIMWVLSEYMEPQRKMRIVGGWESGMGLKDQTIEIRAPKAEGDRLPKPAYNVRVQTQKSNEFWTDKFTQLLMQAAEVSAQGGKPIPPDIFISMLPGYPDKGRVVRMLQSVGTMSDDLAAAQAQIAQLQEHLKGKEAVIQSDALALGTPSIGGGAENAPDYEAMIQAMADGGQ